MPFTSDAQRKFMHAVHPAIAKKWDAEYPDQKGLPAYANGKPDSPMPKSPWLNMKKSGG